MALELFRVMAGIDIIMAHYKGAGAATIDLLGGTIHISNITIQAAVPHIKTGRIRALGVGGPKRSALLPDVPTVDESGLTGYLSTGWRGLMGPAGIPAPVSARLTREIKAILSSDEVRTHFLNNAMEIDYRDPQQFAVFIGEEIKRWSVLVRKANISLDTKK
jgi:tripartite-type tricarboxylate transporter receptor subunit TctC